MERLELLLLLLLLLSLMLRKLQRQPGPYPPSRCQRDGPSWVFDNCFQRDAEVKAEESVARIRNKNPERRKAASSPRSAAR